jgi:DNA-binding winged helix-turn-helix (wHTH) protein/TolB-like protein/Flp pilus assembly protein TadD
VKPSIQIGEWAVDPQSNQLFRGSEIVRVEPKVMGVLMLLAGNAGRVVTRDEIFAALWPRTVVGDEALTQSVIKLRRALRDNPRAPAYIETISKRGYRLIAPVTSGEAADAPHAANHLAPAAGSRSPARTIPRAAAWMASLIVALLAVGAYVVTWLSDGIESADASASSIAAGAWITVSIEPFESFDSAGDHAHLARGISDDLATDLSRVPGLRVIRSGIATSRSATAQYSVSGSAQRDGGTMRINVFLLDAASREQLWAGRFERPYGDLFSLQDEITRKVLDVLPAKVSEAERSRIAKRYTHSLLAYDAFQRGQALFLARTSMDNEEARAFYREAIALDPKFARAYASLAMTYAMDYRLGGPGESSRALDRAFELAETARLIDPDVPQVYWALGFVHAQSRRHEQSIQALMHAIELDPSFADGYALLGGIRTYIGQPRETIPLLRAAMRLNPNGGYLYFLLLGRAYLFENDLDQALINLRAAAQRNPADIETRVFLAATLAAAGDLADARWEADEIQSLQPTFSAREWLETYPMTSKRQQERLLDLLHKVQL